MAEYLARYYAKRYNLALSFKSAGFINAFSYMQPQSQEYLNSKGINHSDFRPQLINKPLLEKQDLILTMEKAQSIEIIKNFFNINDIDKKVMTLKEFTGDSSNPDILDPYYTNSDTYSNILKIIESNIKKLIQKILENSK